MLIGDGSVARRTLEDGTVHGDCGGGVVHACHCLGKMMGQYRKTLSFWIL